MLRHQRLSPWLHCALVSGALISGALVSGALRWDPVSRAALAQVTPGHEHHGPPDAQQRDEAHGHNHDLGPAGTTYDLRWIDAMVQHHSGALRMSELVFNSCNPGIGALAREIWQEQSQEIRTMGLWRRAWYPQAPVGPLQLREGGNPDSLNDLERMDASRIAAMQMAGHRPTPASRSVWFLEGMLEHHGVALAMAHEGLERSTNPSLRRLARQIIVAQRREIIRLRQLMAREGLRQDAYQRYDHLFQLP